MVWLKILCFVIIQLEMSWDYLKNAWLLKNIWWWPDLPLKCSVFVTTNTRGYQSRFPLKPETHRADRWPFEAFGETRTSSGTKLFGVFSCGGSFWSGADSVCSDSTCKVWEGCLSAIWAIGFSDWLYASSMTTLMCASESVRCVGGAEYCVCFVFLCTPCRLFLFSCFVLLAGD